MRLINIIWLFLPIFAWTQENFFFAHDHNSLSQSYSEVIYSEGSAYVLGTTICNSGECGVLSKYNSEGELEFLKEIDNIDINSYRCLGSWGDTLTLIGLSKYEVGARVQMYDKDGNLLSDQLIKRDDDLIYTWPVDVLYKEECFYLVANENYENESRQTAVYKVDYAGLVLDYVRLPFYYRGEILTLTELQNGNLFVTRPYIDEEACAFEHVDVDSPNAVIFYEIGIDSLNIIREKQNMCYQSTNSVSYDCTVLSNNTIVRNVLWRDSLDEDIIHSANIYYNSDWEEIGIDKNRQLIVGNPLASYGIIGNRSFLSQDLDYYYVIAGDRYPVEGEAFPYVDFLIQKWDIDRNLIWQRVISDPNVYHRIYFNSLYETDSEIILAGVVWRDYDIAATRDFAIMSLDLDGCYNGDCSDTIYINGPPTSVNEEEEDITISLFPNPVLDVLNVKSVLPLRSIALYGMDGVLIKKDALSGFEYRLDLGELSSGMYVVRVETDEYIYMEKVIKL